MIYMCMAVCSQGSCGSSCTFLLLHVSQGRLNLLSLSELLVYIHASTHSSNIVFLHSKCIFATSSLDRFPAYSSPSNMKDEIPKSVALQVLPCTSLPTLYVVL